MITSERFVRAGALKRSLQDRNEETQLPAKAPILGHLNFYKGSQQQQKQDGCNAPKAVPSSESHAGGFACPLVIVTSDVPSGHPAAGLGIDGQTPSVLQPAPPVSLLGRISCVPKPRVPVPLAPYRTFSTQQQAFDYVDEQPLPLGGELRVFAEETAVDGRRRFIATTPSKMWAVYGLLNPTERHHYEIIRGGRPCHLYFDLEFVPSSNPGLDGDALVVTLIRIVRQHLKDLFGIVLRKEWVLELDSSTPSKFSRHVIVRIKRAAFKDNSHVNAFVSGVVEKILKLGQVDPSKQYAGFVVLKPQRDTGPMKGSSTEDLNGNSTAGLSTLEGYSHARAENDALVASSSVFPEDRHQEFFVDTAVYTRNRAFRIYMSSKYGKSAILKSTRRFGGPFIAGISSLLEGNLGINGVNAHGKVSSRSPSGIQTTLTDINQEGTDWLEALTGSADTIEPLGQKQHEELFFSSLICHVDPCSRLLRAYDEGDGHAASRHQGIFHPFRSIGSGGDGTREERGGRSTCLDMDPRSKILDPGSRISVHDYGHHPGQDPSGPPAWRSLNLPLSYGPSPLGLLDAFVEAASSQGGVPGRIRSWSIVAGRTMVFNIKNNRWCGNIGGPHKSNGVFYTVDLVDGTWNQKCYDPCCRNYRSSTMPLSKEVWDSCTAWLGQHQR